MKWDTFWQIARYILIAVGSFATGKGWVTDDQVTAIVGAIGTIGAVLWGLFVKSGTTAVPDAVAARADVPTVSAATGAVQS
jgi:pantothenate kinase